MSEERLQLEIPSIPARNGRIRLLPQLPLANGFGNSAFRFQSRPDSKSLSSKYNNILTTRNSSFQDQQHSVSKPNCQYPRLVRVMVAPHLAFLTGVKEKIEKQGQSKVSSECKKYISKGPSKQQEKQEKARNRRKRNEQSELKTLLFNQQSKNRRLGRNQPVLQSAVFKSPQRQLDINRESLGPGRYSVSTQLEKLSDRGRAYCFRYSMVQKKRRYKQQQKIDFGKVFYQQKYIQQEERADQTPQQKNTHQFVIDNHDRFGQEIYPVKGLARVPSPTRYHQGQLSIQQQTQKDLQRLNERQMLKSWFNRLN